MTTRPKISVWSQINPATSNQYWVITVQARLNVVLKMLLIIIPTLLLPFYQSELDTCFPLSMETPGDSTMALTHDTIVVYMYILNFNLNTVYC